MDKKKSLQIFLIFFLILSSIFFYKKFFNTSTNISKKILDEKEIDNDNLEIDKQDKTENLIESLRYVSQDLIGNTYIINAESAKFEKDKIDNIILFEVKAEIIPQNGEAIKIYSDIANYNKTNNDTVFKKDVNIRYGDQIINSEVVKLNFSENLIEIIENVHYMNNNTQIYADKVELNLLSKIMKISMINQDDKIQITGKY
tara:strand:- start:640 stop:1242 length:603 start_codon:yes stop_codon:yes gene_type:complete